LHASVGKDIDHDWDYPGNSRLILYFAGGRLTWLGRLPGDIRIERENFKLYFPLTTMIILSLLLTLILWIIRKIH
jgi:hypothetical protein